MLINAYSTHRSPPPLDFPHTVRARRDRTDPALAEHLRGFMGFVMDRGKRPMTATRYAILRHLERVRHQLSFEAEEEQLDDIAEWALEANAILFLTDGTIRAPDGRVLVDPQTGESEEGASVPYPEDAERRKERTLRTLEVAVPPSLPPVVGEVEVEVRDPAEVAQRCSALFACALRAESLAHGDPLTSERILELLPTALSAMSPKERAFFTAEAPEQQDIVDHGWRYEALAVLAWALRIIDELPAPGGICDVPQLAKTMLALDQSVFVHTARLRPTPEILDALDRHFRLHRVTTDARVRDADPPAELHPGVVQERHYALNWLTRFEDADWDDVDTPT
jgi:hypothetical protein